MRDVIDGWLQEAIEVIDDIDAQEDSVKQILKAASKLEYIASMIRDCAMETEQP